MAVSVGSSVAWLAMDSAMASRMESNSAPETAFCSWPKSLAPKWMATSTPKPCVKPWAMPLTSQLSQSAAPTEASAVTPSPWPTMAVSTTTYSCCKMLPSISGRAKRMSKRRGEPSAMLLIELRACSMGSASSRFRMQNPFFRL